MNIQEKIKKIEAMRFEKKEVFKGENYTLANGKEVIISPIPALDLVDFCEILGMIIDILKNEGVQFDKDNFIKEAMKYAANLVLVLIDMIVGDNIKGVSLSDIFEIADIVINQNFNESIQKKMMKMMRLLGIDFNSDLSTVGNILEKKDIKKKN